ncbi:hypothetical protein BH11BAC1_BH11BAC1_20160 [soil metagenome]
MRTFSLLLLCAILSFGVKDSSAHEMSQHKHPELAANAEWR